MCANYKCSGGTAYTVTIKSGAAVSENVSANGVIQPFCIENSDGQTLGCLQVYADGMGHRLHINVSRMTTCPGRPIRLTESRD